MPVSSRKTRRAGSHVGAAACHCTRAAAMSGRSCSDACTVLPRKSSPRSRDLADVAAEGLQTTKVIALLSTGIDTIEVVGTEILKRHLVSENVIRDDEDGVGHGNRCA